MDEVPAVTELEEHVVEVLVLVDIIELCHVLAGHVLHALDFPLEVDDHVLVFP